MSFLLLRRNSRIPATHTIVMRLVHLVVETGALTATAATLDLILLLAFPDDNYHAAVTFTLAKLYSNSLLVLFNNRTRLQRCAERDVSLDTSIFDSGGALAAAGPIVSMPARGVPVRPLVFINASDSSAAVRTLLSSSFLISYFHLQSMWESKDRSNDGVVL